MQEKTIKGCLIRKIKDWKNSITDKEVMKVIENIINTIGYNDNQS